MDIPLIETITSEEEARDFAIQYQHWQSEQSLSWGEVADWNCFFEKLGEKFDLTEEFKENGIC